MRHGRPAKSENDVIRYRFWARHLSYAAYQAYAAGQLEGMLSTPPKWASIERLIAKSSEIAGASYGKLQSLERVAKAGNDPTKIVRRIAEGDWDEAGIHKPSSIEIRIVNGTEIRYAVIKLNLVELAENIFSGSSDWFDAKVWELLDLEKLSPREVEKITDHCLRKLGLYRSHLVVTKNSAYGQATAEDKPAPPSASESELFAEYEAELLPLAEYPTPDGLSVLTSMLFEASYIGNECLIEIHGDLLQQALENIEKRQTMGETIERLTWEGDPSCIRDRNIVGMLASAIFDAANEFVERSLPPVHRMSLAFPPRRILRTDLA